MVREGYLNLLCFLFLNFDVVRRCDAYCLPTFALMKCECMISFPLRFHVVDGRSTGLWTLKNQFIKDSLMLSTRDNYTGLYQRVYAANKSSIAWKVFRIAFF